MGRYRSVQSTLIESALKGITDNQTVTAYKKDCNYIIELYIDLCYITGRCVGNHAPLLYTTI